MKKLLFLFGLLAACPLIGRAQVPGYQNVIFVGSAPSGACTNGSPAQIVITTGVIYTCQGGTWATAGGGGGSGTVSAAAQYDVPYYTQAGTTAQVGGAAIAGFQFDSTSGAPAAATATNLGALLNISQYNLLVSGGTSSAAVGISPGALGTFLSGQGASANPSFVSLSAVNPQTATYPVLAADFSGYKTISVASGTFTITLVASGSQPANGQYISIVNYGSGVVTVARNGQNINGGTASLTINAGSALAPTSAQIWSDGANYFATVDQGTVGTVTSVAQTFTGGLISVGGSPVTGSGTLALTVAGTSGGIPYFSSTSAWASSGLLTNHGLLVGGGAGAAPAALAVGGANFPLIGQAAANPTFSTIAYPTSLTSGGFLYASSTTAIAGSALIAANVLPKSGGAGTQPGASSITDNGTTVTSTDTGGFVAPVFVSNGATAGFFDFTQGSTSAAVSPCNTANSICLMAPTSVTSQLRVFASSPASGFPLFSNSSGTMTETITGTQGTLSAGPFTFGGSAINTVVAQTIATYAGHFTNLVLTSSLGGSCTTAPTFNVFDGTSNTGTAKLATSTTQTKGTTTNQSQTLTFAAGDIIGIYISSAGATCTTDTWTVSAQYSEP